MCNSNTIFYVHRTTPVGVASMCAKTIAETEDVNATFRKLGLYFATVMITLLVWGLMAMPLLFYAIRRTNPFRFLATLIPSIMIVFATGSRQVSFIYYIYYKGFRAEIHYLPACLMVLDILYLKGENKVMCIDMVC